MDVDYYKVLGVDPEADIEVIKAAYRAKAAARHPDRGGSHRQMLLVNEAWGVLSNPNSRRAYDEMRETSRRHEEARTVPPTDAHWPECGTAASATAGPNDNGVGSRTKFALASGGVAAFLLGYFHVISPAWAEIHPLAEFAIVAAISGAGALTGAMLHQVMREQV